MTIEFEIKHDISKCTGCGICVEACLMGLWEIVTVEGDNKSRNKDPDDCVMCHVCELRCPSEAIKVYPPLGEEMEL